MEIKTTEQIKDSKYKRMRGGFFYGKKWVAVDDLIKWINECDDGTAFNEYQIRKKTILNALSNDNKKED